MARQVWETDFLVVAGDIIVRVALHNLFEEEVITD
jgi:hypothetical protein